MNGGLIKCECGQEQWAETVNDKINCISCGKNHDVYPLPEPKLDEEVQEEPEEELPLEEGE